MISRNNQSAYYYSLFEEIVRRAFLIWWFDRVDWRTIYAVRQCVAQTLSANNDRVLLAGDSAHQHSSAAAQGQNQGLHASMAS
jgi:2-polyprenyl-6-methoxyphenol hydroxylase-like FAD-dependent oxidoreductase